MSTKAVRFNEKEERAIMDFLQKNPYFDFSTLARMAIINFIENPELKLKASSLNTETTTESKKWN